MTTAELRRLLVLHESGLITDLTDAEKAECRRLERRAFRECVSDPPTERKAP